MNIYEDFLDNSRYPSNLLLKFLLKLLLKSDSSDHLVPLCNLQLGYL